MVILIKEGSLFWEINQDNQRSCIISDRIAEVRKKALNLDYTLNYLFTFNIVLRITMVWRLCGRSF